MDFKRLAFLLGIAAGLTWLLRTYAFEAIYIPTASMEPTLPVGIHLFLDKVTFSLRTPSRGDVIDFASPVPPYDEELVKRVIATGGDTVELRDKKVFLNGQELVETYVRHIRSQEKLIGDNLGPLQVPADSIFVLGDNRDESNDSSVWKDPKTGDPIYFVPLSKVRGIVRGAY